MSRATERHEAFAQLVAGGSSQADAYRQVYPASQKWSPSAVWVKASELAGKVSGRIDALRAELAERGLWKREESVKVLAEIATGGEKDADRVRAVAELNTMHGYNAPQKVEVGGPGGGPLVIRIGGQDVRPEELGWR